jgi:hypothetical protein
MFSLDGSGNQTSQGGKMKRLLLLCVLLSLASVAAHSQCTVNLSTGGTMCAGPLSVITGAPGQSPTTAIVFAAATDANPCPSGGHGSPSICFNSLDQLTVDNGSGPMVLGQQGEPGVNGKDGTDGQNGATGPAGLAASVSVGVVTTLPPGSKAMVTNSGTLTDAVFNFSIPKGDSTVSVMPKTCTLTMSWSNQSKTKGTATFSNCK